MADARPKLLAVDDEPDNLDLIERIFHDRFDVHRAASGAAALELCRAHQFEVIISDQRMPEMTGIEFLQASMALQPDAVRIVLTAYEDHAAVLGAINLARAYRFFTKPFQIGDMKDAVETAVHNTELQRENARLVEQLRQNREDLVRYASLLREYNHLLEELDVEAQ